MENINEKVFSIEDLSIGVHVNNVNKSNGYKRTKEEESTRSTRFIRFTPGNIYHMPSHKQAGYSSPQSTNTSTITPLNNFSFKRKRPASPNKTSTTSHNCSCCLRVHGGTKEETHKITTYSQRVKDATKHTNTQTQRNMGHRKHYYSRFLSKEFHLQLYKYIVIINYFLYILLSKPKIIPKNRKLELKNSKSHNIEAILRRKIGLLPSYINLI